MPRYKRLDVSMNCQKTQYWCWAAVTESINRWAGMLWKDQAGIASEHVGSPCSEGDLPHTDDDPKCGAATPCARKCNSAHMLSKVLEGQNHLVRAVSVKKSGQLTFDRVVEVIDGGKPLPLRISFPNGGHFVCVIGYADDGQGNEFVAVLDPMVPGVGSSQASVRDTPFDMLTNGSYPLFNEIGIVNFFYEL